MDIIKWRASYETGIRKMDEEHKQLIVVINTLFNMIRSGEKEADLKKVYDTLSAYTQKHFRHEEEILKKHGYEDFDDQKFEHSQFIEELEKMRSELDSNSEEAVAKVYKFLREWWIDHIVGSDKKYSQFLKEKGE
jgi:hemerythrin